jgi:hypothetical protein
MNGKIKFHKATGPAFNVGEIWVSATGTQVVIVNVSKYPGATEDHTDDYSVTYRNTVDNSVHEKDAWNFQVRYNHVADTFDLRDSFIKTVDIINDR